MAREVDVPALADGVRRGERSVISRAITLVESSLPRHRAAARDLLALLSTADEPDSVVRVGISGVPGVGKSSFIETLGLQLVDAGHRVGVLAVDPSSTRTGGSVLGDKTRMSGLAASADAYIRPSPAAGTLGGVARATMQASQILQAGGFDVILIETVGVGQSEVTVSQMVDSFLFLTLARTGDQLQGIKKGILELADVVAINKADGDRVNEAKAAARDLFSTMRMVRSGAGWIPPVEVCSALTGDGITDVWSAVAKHRESLGPGGVRVKRQQQRWDFTMALVQDEIVHRLRQSRSVAAVEDEVRGAVESGTLPPSSAADQLLRAFDHGGDAPIARQAVWRHWR